MKFQALVTLLLSASVAADGRKLSKKGSSASEASMSSSSSSSSEDSTSFIDEAVAAGNYGTLLSLVTGTPGVLDAVVANAPVSK